MAVTKKTIKCEVPDCCGDGTELCTLVDNILDPFGPGSRSVYLCKHHSKKAKEKSIDEINRYYKNKKDTTKQEILDIANDLPYVSSSEDAMAGIQEIERLLKNLELKK